MVDVYLIKDHPKLGKAGSVVEVKPGYARNVLVPNNFALLMGEGIYRKKLPVLYEKELSKAVNITQKMIMDEKSRWLEYEVPVCSLIM